jgi:predicted dehydrogenase
VALRASRFSAGHPDGYALAFATLYRDFAHLLMRDGLGVPSGDIAADLPSADAGISSMRVIEAVVRSGSKGHQWTEVDRNHA